MAHHEPVSVDPNELNRAQHMWHNFTQWLKYGSVGVAALLVVMAAAFIDW